MILKTVDNVQAICNSFLYNVKTKGSIINEVNEIYKFLKLFNSSEISKIEELISSGSKEDMFIYLNNLYEHGIDITKFNINPFLSTEFISQVYELFPYMGQLPHRVDGYVANLEIKSNTLQSLMYDLSNTSTRVIHKYPRVYIWNCLAYLDKRTLINISSTELDCSILASNKIIYHPYFKIRFKIKKSKYARNGIMCVGKFQFYAPSYSYCKVYKETVIVDMDKTGSIYENVAKKICYNIFRENVMKSITIQNFVSSDEYILTELSDAVFDINPVTNKKINKVKGW